VGEKAQLRELTESLDDSGSADLTLRILYPLARWLEDQHGTERLEEICASAGIKRGDLDGRASWVSLPQFESLISQARALMADDAEFKQACTYQFGQGGYGALRFVVMALSPKAVYEQCVKSFSVVSAISRGEFVALSSTHFICRYFSSKPESKLLCLSRMAQIEKLPTLWGLPSAQLQDRKCITRGDDCCEYEVRTYQHRRDLPVVLGAVVGLLLGLAVTSFELTIPIVGVLGLLGAAIGYAVEQRRTNRVNLAFGQELHDAFARIALEDADARRELFELSQRQRDWDRMLQARVAEQSAAMQDVVERLSALNKARQDTLRGVSHDLRNPLTWLSVETDFLRQYLADAGPQAHELVENHEQAVERMKRLLGELMQIAISDTSMIPLEGKTMDVTDLSERLRKRLSALVRDRDVRVSVFSNRETPTTIVTDALVFDRVVDNLLTNAAKYTSRGSIVVELDGTPGFLTIKVSDTGHGIKQEEIAKIFEARKGHVPRGTVDSYGLGLSVVVQLLDQIGGKLEVMSKEGQGSTFWAHFPIVMKNDRDPHKRSDDVFERVVTIRRTASS
jgi:signal transduction histidine kinase